MSFQWLEAFDGRYQRFLRLINRQDTIYISARLPIRRRYRRFVSTGLIREIRSERKGFRQFEITESGRAVARQLEGDK